nr:unnamed protein product [Haemonchus contortus]
MNAKLVRNSFIPKKREMLIALRETISTLPSDEALKVLPGSMNDIEPSVRTCDEEGEKARSLGPVPFPLDDDILAKLTASEFTIDAETRITVDGIKSFVGVLASGKHELIRGRIRIHISSGSLPFSTPPNIKVFYDGSILTLWHIMPIKLQQ